MVQQQSVEDYLKSIYLLAASESPVRTSRLAAERDVKPASVTNMVQRLAEQKLVHYRKHFGVTLTEEGEAIALRILRYHGLLELFLMEALDYGWEEVHHEAERLEHVITEQFAQRLDEKLGSPKFDPHGEPIPQVDGTISAIDHRPLTMLQAGEEGLITGIVDDSNRELLAYLFDLGLVPGTRLKVMKKEPFEGPINVTIDDKLIVVGNKIADAILVEAVTENM